MNESVSSQFGTCLIRKEPHLRPAMVAYARISEFSSESWFLRLTCKYYNAVFRHSDGMNVSSMNSLKCASFTKFCLGLADAGALFGPFLPLAGARSKYSSLNNHRPSTTCTETSHLGLYSWKPLQTRMLAVWIANLAVRMHAGLRITIPVLCQRGEQMVFLSSLNLLGTMLIPRT